MMTAAAIAALPAAARARWLRGLSADEAGMIEHDWSFWARPEQCPPAGDWRVWMILAGRGFGKTRAGAEWVSARARAEPQARIALVGANFGDVRQVMVEGESGLLNLGPPAARPMWQASLGRLIWPSGARAFVYSAEAPEGLRGAQHHYAWCDELGKWVDADAAWDNLQMGLRLGARPRALVTTTPRGTSLLRALANDPAVAITRGRTGDNAMLPQAFLDAMTAAYGGTRAGRQELDGELLDDLTGALWSRALIEACRCRRMDAAARVVIGVDPPAGVGRDACGIVVVALDPQGRAVVIEDASVEGETPEGWARAVAGAADRHNADKVVAEANNGGAMVASVLRAASAALPLRLVHASRGKVARAEPIAALYTAGRVAHLGAFPRLEDELCGLVVGGGYQGPGGSPDRADALVWALTELMLSAGQGAPTLRHL